MSIYDVSGELKSPKVDSRLHEYWTECQLYRREGSLDTQEFTGCMFSNSAETSLPLAARLKILKFTGVKAA